MTKYITANTLHSLGFISSGENTHIKAVNLVKPFAFNSCLTRIDGFVL